VPRARGTPNSPAPGSLPGFPGTFDAMNSGPPTEPGIRPTLRPAEESDAGRLTRLWADAFPGARTVQDRLAALLRGDGPYGGLETCWVAEVDGTFVGGLRTYALRMCLWGEELPVQGLAAVAVAPEARRAGVGHAMCREALRIGAEKGDLLSALFPFRVGFYARLDYALAGRLERYRFRPEALPLFPERERVVRLSTEEAMEKVASCYQSLLPRFNGLIRRGAGLWRTHLEEGPVQVWGVVPEGADPRGGGALSGYLIGHVPPPRSRETAGIRIRELVAADLGSYRGLLGWVSAQRDQWRRVQYDALPGEHFHQLLDDPRIPGRAGARTLWFESATLLRGPMLRVLDVDGVLEASGLDASPDVKALPTRLFTELYLSGGLPGQAQALRGWEPALGLPDFRLLDVF